MLVFVREQRVMRVGKGVVEGNEPRKGTKSMNFAVFVTQNIFDFEKKIIDCLAVRYS